MSGIYESEEVLLQGGILAEEEECLADDGEDEFEMVDWVERFIQKHGHSPSEPCYCAYRVIRFLEGI